jgi:hypothetical protein
MSSKKRKTHRAKVETAIRDVTLSPFMQTMTRVSYAVRGCIYILVSVLALQIIFGIRSVPASQQGAITLIANQPFGMVLLWLVLAGTIGYSLWGLARAVLARSNRGDGLKGALHRIGFLISALGYASLAIFTYGYLAGASHSSQGLQDFIKTGMQLPFGRWLIAILGVITLTAGIHQIYQGFTATFDRQFQIHALTRKQVRLTTQIGQWGTMARGVVFSVTGILIIVSAYRANSSQPVGMDAALMTLLRQPHGSWLLTAVAVGLMAFGFYSILIAFWFHAEGQV